MKNKLNCKYVYDKYMKASELLVIVLLLVKKLNEKKGFQILNLLNLISYFDFSSVNVKCESTLSFSVRHAIYLQYIKARTFSYASQSFDGSIRL